ncbi:DUF11 domain-containing protein [Leucothrix sargassi]|nr:DUF11 domain-containing protein [Leucothrix sargassi]
MIIRLLLTLLIIGASQLAGAAVITPYLEIVKITSVGATWKTVPLANSYSNPIIACTYVLPSASDNAAVVRVRPAGSGFEVRTQHPIQSNDVTAGDVHCTISEEGSYSYPIKYEAHKVSSALTNYGGNWTALVMQDVTANKVLSYDTPVVIGQVMTFNNDHFSVFWANDCVDRRNEPTDASICVGKHTGQVNPVTPNAEDLGYFIAEEAEYFTETANIKIAVGNDSIAGVGNSPPYAYDLGRSYSLATASSSSEDGGNGGWAVLYGSNPVSTVLNLAIEEDTAAGDQTRRHTNERVSYWAVDPIDTTSPRANMVINEVLYNAGTGLDEFVEFYVTSSGSIENYVVNGQDGATQNTLLPDVNVTAGDYVILHFASGTNNTVGNVHHLYTGSNNAALLNSADDILLLKPSTLDITILPENSGTVNAVPVDYISYGSAGSIDSVPTSENGVTVNWNDADGSRLAGAVAGQSISLTRNGVDTDTSVCWELTTSGEASACPNYIATFDHDASAFINSLGQDNNFAPILTLDKSVLTIYDPYNGASNPKAIPGSVLEYTITASNSGPAPADNNTIRITDMIPDGTKLCVSNSGFCVPPYFVDGSPSSGLTLGTIEYSTNGGSSYSSSSSPDGEGVDTSITHLTAPTIGSFQPLTAGVASSFSLKFRVVVQ